MGTKPGSESRVQVIRGSHALEHVNLPEFSLAHRPRARQRAPREQTPWTRRRVQTRYPQQSHFRCRRSRSGSPQESRRNRWYRLGCRRCAWVVSVTGAAKERVVFTRITCRCFWVRRCFLERRSFRQIRLHFFSQNNNFRRSLRVRDVGGFFRYK